MNLKKYIHKTKYITIEKIRKDLKIKVEKEQEKIEGGRQRRKIDRKIDKTDKIDKKD